MLGLREMLESRRLVNDRATGTLLADRGVQHPLDKSVLAQPRIVRDLHEEYPRPGVRAAEDNTYAANRIRLEARNLAERSWGINAAGTRLARGGRRGPPKGRESRNTTNDSPLND